MSDNDEEEVVGFDPAILNNDDNVKLEEALKSKIAPPPQLITTPPPIKERPPQLITTPPKDIAELSFKEALKLTEEVNIEEPKSSATAYREDNTIIPTQATETKAANITPPPEYDRVVKEEKDTNFVLEGDLYKKPVDVFDGENDEEEEIIEQDTVPHIDLNDQNIKPTEIIIDESGKLKPIEEDGKEKKKGGNVLEHRLAEKSNMDIHGYGIDDLGASVVSENQVLSKLRKFDIPVEKITAINADEASTHQAFLKQYMSPSLSPIVAPRLSRFPVLLSGYYAEMRNYTYGEHSSVIKNATNPDLKYSNRFQEELVSLFQHITWTSLTDPTKNPLTFEQWIKATLFPDLAQFYYGAFDATYPGVTNYRVTCGVRDCGEEFSVGRTNKELNYILRKGIKPSFIRDILMERIPAAELKNLSVYRDAHTLYEDKVLPDIHFRIAYGIPTIMDILEWLTVFDETLGDEYEDFNGLVDTDKPEHNFLKLFTYIKKVTVPVTIGQDEKGRDILRFHCIDGSLEDNAKRLENKKQIMMLLKDLDKDIFRELFTGKEVKAMVDMVGIVHMLHNVKCPKCGTNLIRIPIDMADTFFMEVASTQRAILQY
jgi:hypothetical protein